MRRHACLPKVREETSRGDKISRRGIGGVEQRRISDLCMKARRRLLSLSALFSRCDRLMRQEAGKKLGDEGGGWGPLKG